ncbi:Hypothetical predicted protein [Mytilus galloprovincialis]|uniref:Rhodanese domain-containing protein n=1 Tax=Mytilus galloprovincialis TaxID=29158 RepID=A0A8B6D9K9_MYTGA|nr:Hypothetical predicted protein [Mytilus galloprovincialis]
MAVRQKPLAWGGCGEGGERSRHAWHRASLLRLERDVVVVRSSWEAWQHAGGGHEAVARVGVGRSKYPMSTKERCGRELKKAVRGAQTVGPHRTRYGLRVSVVLSVKKETVGEGQVATGCRRRHICDDQAEGPEWGGTD